MINVPNSFKGFIQSAHFPPERIIYLTEETGIETLYLLGQQDRIVGVTGYAVRPRVVPQG